MAQYVEAMVTWRVTFAAPLVNAAAANVKTAG